MNSLKEVFTAMQECDYEKVAQAQVAAQYGPQFADVDTDLLKQAQDYDHIGRILAHSVFTDMIKDAMDEEMPESSDEEKKEGLEAVMAAARGEKKPEKKGLDEENEESKEGETEKKAALRAAVLERMAEDPEYVSQLIAKHYG